jgi:hypothetical protein
MFAPALGAIRLAAREGGLQALRVQYTTELARRREVNAVNLREAIEYQAPSVRAAALAAHQELVRLGIPHAFVGGLAVGAHGYVRATSDVDFLVGEEAFEEHGAGIVTFRPGVPIHVGGVSIDYLTAAKLGAHLRAVLEHPLLSDGLPVVPVEDLVFMKLVAHRMRDRADVTELLKRGIDATRVRPYLATHAPDLLPSFEALVEQAARE